MNNMKSKEYKNYYKLYYQQKDRIKVLQKELITYRKYGQMIRAIKYILAYSERVGVDKLIQLIKEQITYK